MRRLYTGTGTLIGVTAASYLAWLLVAFLLLEWPRLFLAAVSEVQLEGIELRPGRWLIPGGLLPHAVTHFPENGSAALYALYHSGSLLWGLGLLLVGPSVIRGATGWWRLFAAQGLLWTAVPLVLYPGLFRGGRYSPLLASLRALGWGGTESGLWPATGLLLGVLLFGAAFLAARTLLDSAGEGRQQRLLALGQWLLGPLVLASLLATLPARRYRGYFAIAFLLPPLVLGLAAGIPAAMAPVRKTVPLQLSRAGGWTVVAVLLAVFSVSVGSRALLPAGERAEVEEWSPAIENESSPTGHIERSKAGAFYHRGISFSHEVGGRWGYGSDHAIEQLQRIRQLGANTVAIVPYAFTRAPRDTDINTRTDETNDRVIRTIRAAKQLGLRVTLKPQLWGRGFTGDIAFDDEADFEHWFGQYRDWMLNYARLAERHGVDLLVIGTELGGVSNRETAWRGLIADVHRLYSGPVTYAANWDREFEALPFWDALDMLGVNMYNPLAAPDETPGPDSPRVRELVEKLGAMAQRHNKKILFTEVGFPSTANAALEPWREDGGPLDTELQARCYETILAAFSRQPWFAGLYWWKWPSHGRGSAHDGSYSPLGKPALAVVARWYGQENEQ